MTWKGAWIDCGIRPRIAVAGEDSARLLEFLLLCDYSPCECGATVAVDAHCTRGRELLYLEDCCRVTEEGFAVAARSASAGICVTLEYTALRGLWYAVNALLVFLAQGRLPDGRFADCPKFESRGFLEGFYGKPWRDGQRRDMLRLMARHGMNRYYYAPKDDPFHRDRWEELYTEEALADLAALADYTAARQMDFVYCLAPGLTIEFSGEAQFMRLMEKFRQVYSVGVRHFGLLLDDIPAELLHETDRVRFGEAVNAHIFLLRRCFAALKAMEPSVRFIVCPMEYHGRGNEYYISRLGQALSGEIELFWTGRNICSQELLEEDAVRFAQHTLHPPLYWDNFPVNDAEMLHEMHLGPLEGREPGLYRHCRGLALNGMEYFECTKVAFLTAARYLWSPEDYDPQMAWLWALEELLGKESAARFLPFAEQLLTSCLKVQNGPRMAAAIDRAAALFRAGNPAAALETLEALMLWMEDCRAFLAQGGHPMLAELGKWIRKYNQCCDVLRQVILVLKAPKKTALRSCLEEKLEEYNENAAVLTEFGFRAFCEKVLEYVS